MPSYLTRLLLLSSASFFLVQMVVGALIAVAAPAAIRCAEGMLPRRAARFLLTLRLLPAALSALAVALLCVPSYLRFEPRAAEEEVGFVCLTAAAAGAWICAVAIARAAGAWMRCSHYVRECDGVESCVDGETVWVVRQSVGLALAGILHPRLLISAGAMRQLSHDQLAAAVRHERAHRASRDNLKRLLILLAPSIFPALRLLEQGWARCAEWAADDQAAGGDADRAAALAEALVCVARLQAGIGMPPLVTSLIEADEDLSPRVDRLLEAAPIREPSFRASAIVLSGVAVLVLLATMSTGSLRIVHHLLERLLD